MQAMEAPRHALATLGRPSDAGSRPLRPFDPWATSLRTADKTFVRALGVSITSITEDLCRCGRIRTRRGVLVTGVLPNSSAEVSGVVRGDVVVRAGGEAVDSPKSLVEVLGAGGHGDSLLLGVVRGTQQLRLGVALRANNRAAPSPREANPGPTVAPRHRGSPEG